VTKGQKIRIERAIIAHFESHYKARFDPVAAVVQVDNLSISPALLRAAIEAALTK
jgi:hypothetical protein